MLFLILFTSLCLDSAVTTGLPNRENTTSSGSSMTLATSRPYQASVASLLTCWWRASESDSKLTHKCRLLPVGPLLQVQVQQQADTSRSIDHLFSRAVFYPFEMTYPVSVIAICDPERQVLVWCRWRDLLSGPPGPTTWSLAGGVPLWRSKLPGLEK